MRIHVATASTVAALILTTVASSPSVKQRTPYRTERWSLPQPTHVSIESSYSNVHSAQPSSATHEDQQRPTQRGYASSHTLEEWKNGWTRPMDSEDWQLDYQDYGYESSYERPDIDDDAGALSEEEYGSEEEFPPTQYEEQVYPQFDEGQVYTRPSPSQEKSNTKTYAADTHHSTPSSRSSRTPSASLSQISLPTLHYHPRPSYPTLASSSQKIYSAPTTIWETRTFTYSYLDSGYPKLAVTTIIGDWAIEQPAGVSVSVSTVWITKWLNAESSTEVLGTMSISTSETSSTSSSSSSSSSTPTSWSPPPPPPPPSFSKTTPTSISTAQKPLKPIPSSTTKTLYTPTPSSTAHKLVKPNPNSLFAKSTQGECGVFANMTTCDGTPFGACCSQFGWCGESTIHCDDGCQGAFGSCYVGKKPVKMPGSLASHVKGFLTMTTAKVSTKVVSTVAAMSTDIETMFVVRPTSTSTVENVATKVEDGKKEMPKPTAEAKKHKTLKEILQEMRQHG